MPRFIARTLTLLMLAVVGMGVTASAQSSRVTRVNIPFEFNFGDRTFPAGEYRLVQPQPHLLILRDLQGRALAQSLTQSIESRTPADATNLKFAFSDGQHSLVEVWQERDFSGERVHQAKSSTKQTKQFPLESGKTAEGGQP